MSVDISIKKKYGNFLLEADLKSSGRRIGILGASGCGKSLTLKSIAGLEKPDTGFVSVNERVLFDSKKRINIKTQDRGVGYLFQEYALFPNMTVAENVSAALHAKRRDNSGIRENGISGILESFGLEEVRDHYPGQLSGGQKQRCALARMLVCDPKLLLLDEPFSAMDAFLREGMRLELIRVLDEYEKQVIIVSHDRDELYQMCDRLVLMDDGRVIAEGDTGEVFRRPGTPKAATLTGCKNISRIEKISDHRIRAIEWDNIELVTDEVITDDVTHVGIRAHDLIPGEHGVNIISCGEAVISKLPFEWYVTLENGLWWKYSKKLGDEESGFQIPLNVSVLPESIIPLREQ